MHLEMCLSLLAKNVHFVLVQTLVTAELQLVLTILEIDIVDSMSDMSTPITCFVALEVGSATLRKTDFGAERFLSSWCLQREQLFVAGDFLAPRAHCATRRDVRWIWKWRTPLRRAGASVATSRTAAASCSLRV